MHPETIELEREKRHLEQAERDIAAGERRVHHQMQLILKLRVRGEDSASAERLLALLDATLAQWKVHRGLIIERIAHIESARHLGAR